jgi:peptidoglycan/LPS O-acetylase OafA/YrhL
MILGMFILPHLSSVFYTSQNEYLNLLFLNNFETDKAVSTTVYIAWSVAIEEQFYLFWPLIFAIFAKNTRYLAIFCALVYIGSSLFILYRPDISYDHTLGNLNYLMVGALGAIALNNSEKKIPEFLYKKWPVLLLNSIAIVLLFIYKPAGYFFIMPFLYLLLVLYVVSLDKLSATTRSKKEVFSFLGKYTYGMYMYHPMFILATKIVFDVCSLNYKDSLLLNMAIGIISLTATIVVAYLSYEYFEKHFLKYKERFSVIKTRI